MNSRKYHISIDRNSDKEFAGPIGQIEPEIENICSTSINFFRKKIVDGLINYNFSIQFTKLLQPKNLQKCPQNFIKSDKITTKILLLPPQKDAYSLTMKLAMKLSRFNTN